MPIRHCQKCGLRVLVDDDQAAQKPFHCRRCSSPPPGGDSSPAVQAVPAPGETTKFQCPFCSKRFSGKLPAERPAKGRCPSCSRALILLPTGEVHSADTFDLAVWKQQQAAAPPAMPEETAVGEPAVAANVDSSLDSALGMEDDPSPLSSPMSPMEDPSPDPGAHLDNTPPPVEALPSAPPPDPDDQPITMSLDGPSEEEMGGIMSLDTPEGMSDVQALPDEDPVIPLDDPPADVAQFPEEEADGSIQRLDDPDDATPTGQPAVQPLDDPPEEPYGDAPSAIASEDFSDIPMEPEEEEPPPPPKKAAPSRTSARKKALASKGTDRRTSRRAALQNQPPKQGKKRFLACFFFILPLAAAGAAFGAKDAVKEMVDPIGEKATAGFEKFLGKQKPKGIDPEAEDRARREAEEAKKEQDRLKKEADEAARIKAREDAERADELKRHEAEQRQQLEDNIRKLIIEIPRIERDVKSKSVGATEADRAALQTAQSTLDGKKKELDRLQKLYAEKFGNGKPYDPN